MVPNFLLSWLLVLLFLLSSGIHSIINFGILSSGIILTWPYHCSLFFSMMSMMSGFPFTPIISFICSFFIISILDFLADLEHHFYHLKIMYSYWACFASLTSTLLRHSTIWVNWECPILPSAIVSMQLQYHTMLPVEEFKKAVCWLLNVVLKRQETGRNQQ